MPNESVAYVLLFCFFFSSRRRHTRFDCDWSSDVCSSDLLAAQALPQTTAERTDYAATSTNAEVGAFLDSLELAGAPVRVSEMGTSALGQPIYFVIASDPTVTSPGEAAASGKLVVYLQIGRAHV